MPYGVKANVVAPHRYLRMGGLCWVHNPNGGSDNERFQVWGISRGGRRVIAWCGARYLGRFRSAWARADEATERGGNKFLFATRREAQEWAEYVGEKYGADPTEVK